MLQFSFRSCKLLLEMLGVSVQMDETNGRLGCLFQMDDLERDTKLEEC